MAAIVTTLNARTADPLIKSLVYIDQSGVGAGPFVPAHALVDATGALITTANPSAVVDRANAAFGDAVLMVVGTVYTAGRSIDVECTVAGTVVFQFATGRTITKSVGVGGQTFPYACTKIVSSTATAVFNNLP